MLEGAGFTVIDLGVNVPPEKFVEQILEHKPEIVGFSAFLTTTMPMFKANINALQKAGLRDKVIVMVGGAPGDPGVRRRGRRRRLRRRRLHRRPQGQGADREAPVGEPRTCVKPLALLEDVIKEPVFGCRTCGQCVLHSTGMTCPMTCPKTLRNGPCGGVRENGHCEVKPEMRCVWVTAVDRAEHLPLLPAKWRHEIDDLRPPVDNRLRGTSSWLNLATGARPPHAGGLEAGGVSALREKLERGDVRRHGRDAGRSTAAACAEVAHQLEFMAHYLDAVNATDNTAAHAHASPLAVALAIRELRLGADHAARLPRPEPAGARGRHRWARRCTASRTSAA